MAKPSMAVKLSVPEAVSLIDVKVSPDCRSECIIQCSDSGNLAQVVHVAYVVVSGATVFIGLSASANRVAVPCSTVYAAVSAFVLDLVVLRAALSCCPRTCRVVLDGEQLRRSEEAKLLFLYSSASL